MECQRMGTSLDRTCHYAIIKRMVEETNMTLASAKHLILASREWRVGQPCPFQSGTGGTVYRDYPSMRVYVSVVTEPLVKVEGLVAAQSYARQMGRVLAAVVDGPNNERKTQVTRLLKEVSMRRRGLLLEEKASADEVAAMQAVEIGYSRGKGKGFDRFVPGWPLGGFGMQVAARFLSLTEVRDSTAGGKYGDAYAGACEMAEELVELGCVHNITPPADGEEVRNFHRAMQLLFPEAPAPPTEFRCAQCEATQQAVVARDACVHAGKAQG